jgi:hypothetical protein
MTTEQLYETNFRVSSKYKLINNKIQKILKKFMIGIFVMSENGQMLYSKKFCESIKIDLISNFISALSMFGEENLGKIDSVFIGGLDIEINIISRHGLILAILFRSHMVTDYLDEEAERGLELFYNTFKKQIDSQRANLDIYKSFDDKMASLIHDYLVRIGEI